MGWVEYSIKKLINSKTAIDDTIIDSSKTWSSQKIHLEDDYVRTLDAGVNPPSSPNNNQLWQAINSYTLSRWNGTKWAKAVEIAVSTEQELTNLISNAGTEKITAVIAEPINLSADIVFPSNILLRFSNGGMLDGNVTVTINGGIDAGAYQIFGDNLNVSGNPVISEILAEWFGCSKSNTDNTNQFIKAYTTARNLKAPNLIFSAGVYKFTNPVSLPGKGVRLIGAGEFFRPVFVQYPDETNWEGTILDFRPVGDEYNGDLLTFGDNNTQVNGLGLTGLSIIGSSAFPYAVLRIKYAPQMGEIKDVLVFQTGSGHGAVLTDIWTFGRIENVWCYSNSTVSNNRAGFWLYGDKYAGGDITLINVNGDGFKYGVKIGTHPVEDGVFKSERNVKLIACQGKNSEIGFFFGYGATQISLENFWVEQVTKAGIQCLGNAREIEIHNGRIACNNLNSGGAGILLGDADSTGINTSLNKRAKVSVRNLYIFNLVNGCTGIVKYAKSTDESLLVEKTFIGAKGTLTDKSDIYGIWFRGNTTPNRSNILIDVSFNEGLAGEILPDNRIVKSPESLSPISSGLDMLKMYIPHIHSEQGRIDNTDIYNTKIDNGELSNSIVISRKEKVFDWTVITTAGFLSEQNPNHIFISNVNAANRAIYLPKSSVSKGKFFFIERENDSYSTNFVNIRLHTTEGGTVLFKLWEGDKYFVYNLNGVWKYYLVSSINKSSSNRLEINNHDLDFPNSANGIILTDRTTGSKYRLFIDNGVLGTEVV